MFFIFVVPANLPRTKLIIGKGNNLSNLSNEIFKPSQVVTLRWLIRIQESTSSTWKNSNRRLQVGKW